MKSRQILQRPDRRRATATLVAGGALAAGLVTVRRAQAQAREVVKIGYSGPLSGGAALYGKNCLDGMLMAAAEVNAAGLEIGQDCAQGLNAVDLAPGHECLQIAG